MSYRRVLVVALLLGLCLGVATATAVPATVSVDAPETASPGETVTVTVDIATDTPVYAAQFGLSFPTAGSATHATPGNFLSQNASTFVVANQVDDGRVSFGESRRETQTGVTGSGTLATVDVTLPADASGSVTLGLSDVKVAASNGSSVPVETAGTTIDIEGATGATGGTDGEASDSTPGAEPTATPVGPTPSAPDDAARVTATKTSPGSVTFTATGEGTVVASLPPTEAGETVGVQLTGLTVRDVTASEFDATVTAVSPDAAGFSGPDDPMLAAFNVTHPSLSADEYGSAELQFTVATSRLDDAGVAPMGVALYRLQNGTWGKLPTSRVDTTADAYVFTARSPGLSTYAVAYEPNATETRTVSGSGSGETTATPTPVAPGTVGSPTDGFGPGFGGVAALLALVGLGVGLGRRD
ncbi:PGF-pre-PGF domain-containing protein [Halorarius litoreus]|uniref:PGF-pre-PGF domain-containing protein n=1 Tax=Halorarius litoreus TaxID=2962676 RepID=UPI0020CCF8DE|nr:PGF-pre-PGF domain-containing protein [Halorarius litoreus]